MRRNVIGFIAFNFILRRIFRGIMRITFKFYCHKI